MRIRIDAAGKWIDLQDIEVALNESDAYALEEALQLKEAQGGEVVAISVGPERAGQTIREALAKGADRGIHVEVSDPDALTNLDSLAIARLLASAIRDEQPDLVLTGLQSDDLGFGQTGVILAELLGIPHATLILKTEVTSTGIRVLRELEDGWFQHIDMPTPALLTIQSGTNKLRYATLMGIKRAKMKELRAVTADLASVAPVLVRDRVTLPSKQRTTEILTGTPAEAAQKLVDKLQAEARVL